MSSQNAELGRNLRHIETYTFGLGTMIGAGLIGLSGIVAEAAVPASMVSYTIVGLVALSAALAYRRLWPVSEEGV